MTLSHNSLREHGVEDALADAYVSPYALLRKHSPAHEPIDGLAGDVGIELDVAHVKQQVGPYRLGSVNASEPLVVSLVLRGRSGPHGGRVRPPL